MGGSRDRGSRSRDCYCFHSHIPVVCKKKQWVVFFNVTAFFAFVDQRKQLSEQSEQDFYEYTRGRKIPPEGIPGFDFSDPESIVEFTK